MSINCIIILRRTKMKIMKTIAILVKSLVCIYTHVITIPENGSNQNIQVYIYIAVICNYRFKCFTTKLPYLQSVFNSNNCY